MLHLLILLLVSGFVSSNREFYLINTTMSWHDAQTYCRQNYVDLATIGSRDDMKRMMDITATSGVTAEVWIGLKKTAVSSWLWSVGQTQTSLGQAVYTNWASSTTSSHFCGGVRGDGRWLSEQCETTLPFICQGGKQLHVVSQSKSWRNAQTYCRKHHTDLVSVMDQNESQALVRAVSGSGISASLHWIGLFKDELKWSDQSNSSFRNWTGGQPNNDGDCVLYGPNNAWWDRNCDNLHPFYCYNNANQVRRQIIRVEIKSSSPLEGSAMNEAILTEIQKNYEGVKVRWVVQPDGEIFHKKNLSESSDLK